MNDDYGLLTDLLRENNTQWQQVLEPILTELGVTFVDRIILDKLAKNSGTSKNDLASTMGTMHQNLTRSINRLEQQGFLVVGKKPSHDNRQIYLDITSEGIRINKIINTKINIIWRNIFSQSSGDDFENLVSTLLLIKNKLSEIKSTN